MACVRNGCLAVTTDTSTKVVKGEVGSADLPVAKTCNGWRWHRLFLTGMLRILMTFSHPYFGHLAVFSGLQGVSLRHFKLSKTWYSNFPFLVAYDIRKSGRQKSKVTFPT
jgi:hypothetical protein